MIKKTVLNSQGLKSFLYNFFIVWNLLVIILLIILNIYISRPATETKKEIPDEWGQFKLKWVSCKKYQDIGTNLFSIAIESLNKDEFKDVVILSKEGILSCLNGKNGYTLFKLNTSPTINHIKLIEKRIVVSATNGEIYLFDSSGKSLWRTKLKDNIVSSAIITKKESEFLAISTKKNLFFINKIKKRIENSISFNLPLFSEILTADFNNDKIADVILGDTESVYCIDGLTANILWQKRISYIYPGKFALIGNNELYLILPLYSGRIMIFNRAGAEVWSVDVSENLIDAPVTFRDKNGEYCFVQPTINGTLACFNFEKRKKLWQNRSDSNMPVKVAAADFNYDNLPEIVVVDKIGKLNIIKSENGKIVDTLNILDNSDENISSNIVIDDIDDDGNYEIAVASDKGNLYVYTYIMLKKRKFWKILLNKKWRWNLYGGNINSNFKFN